MKICIDISQVVYGTGVSEYIRHIVTNLLHIDTKNEYILYAGSLRRFEEIKSFYNDIKTNSSKLRILPLPPKVAEIFFNRIRPIRLESLVGEYDVLHTSDNTEPRSHYPKVTTIHDVAPILFPQYTPPEILKNFSLKLELAKSECKNIICPSNTTKNDLLKLGFSKDKLHVINEGISEEFMQQKSMEQSEKRNFGITGKYLLSVGVSPRKNIERIINSFNKLRKSGFIDNLVIVGGEIQNHLKSDGVVTPGYVSRSDLPKLYGSAEALIYPSIYEGFGLPIIQAMSQGCPVVTSNIGSMKEIAEGRGCLVDPFSEVSIASGIKRILESGKKDQRKNIEYSKSFSWRKAAEKTLKIYEKTNN